MLMCLVYHHKSSRIGIKCLLDYGTPHFTNVILKEVVLCGEHLGNTNRERRQDLETKYWGSSLT